MQKSWILCLTLLLVGCAQTKRVVDPPAAAEGERFEALVEEYLTGYLAWRPQAATSLGLHQYDGRTTDYRRSSIDAELTRLKNFERRLEDFHVKRLTAQEAYDYRILKNAVKREIFTFEAMDAYTRNPMTYAGALDVSIYVKRDFAPLSQRVESIISILNQAGPLFTAARANLAESLPRPQIETAIEQANGTADFLSKDLVQALSHDVNGELKSRFTKANDAAIAELRGYAEYLKEQKLPKANEKYALGRGKYSKLLEYGEMVTLSPEQLLKIGLEELRRKQQSFAEDARQIDPTRKPIDVFLEIQKDHPTAESLIPDTAKNLEMIRKYLIDHDIITIPSKVRAQVAETPQFLRATSFASMDTPGPFETKATEAYYYITPVEKDWSPQQQNEWLTAFNYYTTDIVSIHEAYPGHYVQFLCLNASPASRLEKIFNSYAFVEGWAHYTEQMMIDNGFGAQGMLDPTPAQKLQAAKYRLAQTDEALLRLCRFCVSIKMHCQGMNVDEATRFFEENCYYQPKPARQEAVRGTFDPEYLYYTLGKLQILKLREDYKQQEGAGYSLKKFHDEMLRHGAPPIRLLREVLLKDPALWPAVL